MKKEQFMKLKAGDKLRYGDHEFHVYMIETSHVDVESGEARVWKVYNNQYQSIEIGDDIVEHIVLVSEPTAKHMVRVELVISGIDVKTKGWGFMEDMIETVVENYGGEITEFHVQGQ
jgi:hypothetical protein